MLYMICLLFPAVISLMLYEKLNATQLRPRQALCLYAVFDLLVNGLVLAVKTYILKTGQTVMLSDGDIAPSVAVNYLIMAIPTAVAVGVICALLRKNTSIEKEE